MSIGEVVRPAPRTGTAPPRLGRVVDAPAVAFVAACIGVAAVRVLVLTTIDAPTGLDAGNWLRIGRAVLGDPVATSAAYAPLVPLMVVGATAAFGLVGGITLVATLASLAPAIGTYVVLRRDGSRWPAVALAGLLLGAASTGEAVAWGGYPQLIGLGFLLPFLASMDGALRDGGVRPAVSAGVLLAAVLFASPFAAVAAIVSVVVLTVWRLGARDPAPRIGRSLAIVGVFCVPFLPLYVRYFSGLASPSVWHDRFGWHVLIDRLWLVVRDAPAFWVPAALATAVAAALRRGRLDTIGVVAGTLLLTGAGSVLVTREPRWLYLVPPAVVLGLGSLWTHVGRTVGLRAIRVCVCVGLAAVTVFGLRASPAQRDYYRVLTPEVLGAFDWLRAETPADAVVAVNAAKSWTLAWWVEGYARRAALGSSGLRWLLYEHEQVEARRANEIFRDGLPSARGLSLARRWGVDHILVTKSWEFYDAADVRAFERRYPGSVVYENGGAVVLEVPR